MAFRLDEAIAFRLASTADIYACRGTPSDDLIYLLEDISTGKPVVRADAEIIEKLNGICSPVILCGHTHIPRCVELSTGQLVINPGSVGLQAYTDDDPNIHSMQNYSSKASYAMLNKTVDGNWSINFYRVSYDVERAVGAAQEQGRDDWVHFCRQADAYSEKR